MLQWRLSPFPATRGASFCGARTSYAAISELPSFENFLFLHQHIPFLSPNPPPADSYIEVETTPTLYTLHIRLPGFRRDAITLATKRRRILHVVADSWEEEGRRGGAGHFERRISFGWDADLEKVRNDLNLRCLILMY